MADIATIRQGLASNLETIRNIQISAYMLAAPTPPCIHIFPATIEFDRGMHRGLDIVNFTVEAFVAFGLDQGGQMRLDRLLAPSGAESVKEAVESDRTLGSTVQDVWVTRLSDYRVVLLPDENDHSLRASWLVSVNN
jgi:hypothetical protein